GRDIFAAAEYVPTAFTASSNYGTYTGLTTAGGMRDAVNNTTSSTHATNFDTNGYVKADLGSTKTIHHINVEGVAASLGWSGYQLTGAHLEYSTDNTTWTQIALVPPVTDD